MLDPSFSRSPEAPVLFARSEPARSTSERRDTFTPLTPDASSVSLNVTTIVNTAWDLRRFVNAKENHKKKPAGFAVHVRCCNRPRLVPLCTKDIMVGFPHLSSDLQSPVRRAHTAVKVPRHTGPARCAHGPALSFPALSTCLFKPTFSPVLWSPAKSRRSKTFSL